MLSIKQQHSLYRNFRKTPIYFYLPDCLLEVSVHEEGPASGHLDTSFLGFPSVFKQKLRWLPSSKLLLRSSLALELWHGQHPVVSCSLDPNIALINTFSNIMLIYVVNLTVSSFR
jgi:hypothetical protein